MRLEFENYQFNRDRSDLISLYSPNPQNQNTKFHSGRLDFQTSSVYKVFPLVFGGFLAFDIDSVSYCRMDIYPHGVYH